MFRAVGDFGDMKTAVVQNRWLVTDEEAVAEVGVLERAAEERSAAGSEWPDADEELSSLGLDGPRASDEEDDDYFDDSEDDDDDDFYDDDLDDDDDDDDFDDDEELEDDD